MARLKARPQMTRLGWPWTAQKVEQLDAMLQELFKAVRQVLPASSGTTNADAITELTGDVTATGPGSVAATIGNDKVTYAKIQNVSAASRLLGRGSASGSGDAQELTAGLGLTISGTVLQTAEWDTIITKASDQDVSSSTTLTDDTELTFAVTNGSVWYIELLIAYAGDATATDMKVSATFPTARGVFNHMSINTADTAVLTPVRINGVTALPTVTVGTRSALTAFEFMKLTIGIAFTADGTFTLQQANNVSGTTRIKAGSILRAKRLV